MRLILTRLLPAGLLLAVTLSPVVGKSSNLCHATPIATSEFGPPPTAAIESTPVDAQLIDAWIASSVRAITLANLGLQRSNDADVRRAALRTAEGRAGELQLLRYWRDMWFPDAPPTQAPSASGSGETSMSSLSADPLNALCSADDDFDRIFVVTMIDHLESDVALMLTIAGQAEHEALIEFAGSTVTSRTSEISILDDFLERKFMPSPEIDG